MKLVFFALVLTFFLSCKDHTGFNIDDNSNLSLKYEYLGKAIQKEGYHIWGSSPIWGKDGKIHIYAAEWPIPINEKEGFNGWYKHCQIGHYVGNTPEGPFEFVGIAVEDLDNEFNSPHNPTVQYIDGKYVLVFIVNENNLKEKQRIIMFVADDLMDNWSPASGGAKDGTIVSAPSDSTFWNYTTTRGTTNPTLIKFGDKYMLYFKSVIPDLQFPENPRKRKFSYGVAVSNKLEGPYEIFENRVTEENLQLEDAFAFTVNNIVYLISRDFSASLGSIGGGLLWRSNDGYNFPGDEVVRAYEDLSHYTGTGSQTNSIIYRGSIDGHLERPQLLIENGLPAYLYVATGINDNLHFGSCSHVFKISIE